MRCHWDQVVGGLISATYCRTDPHGKIVGDSHIHIFLTDETTLSSGRHRWRGRTAGPAENAGPLKMFQHELYLGLLCQDVRSSIWTCWYVPLVCPLQCADRRTGENTHFFGGKL